MKTCTKCGEVKPKTEFNKDSHTLDSLRRYCRECQKIANKERRNKNPNEWKEYHYKSSYNISLDQYNEMFNLQQGCCDICGTHQSKLKRNLAVDHCHSTGKVRKLLCSNCNSGIGKLQENIEILKKAISYLEEHNFD